jgi:hypothetical protein
VRRMFLLSRLPVFIGLPARRRMAARAAAGCGRRLAPPVRGRLHAPPPDEPNEAKAKAKAIRCFRLLSCRGNLGRLGAQPDENPGSPGNLGNPAPIQVTLITLNVERDD